TQGILGSVTSGKSALVHRYLTGSYVREESPEGGRFKKEIVVDGQSFLLLIRDEGGPPEIEFSNWVDGVIFVFSLEDETSFHSIYNYYRRLVQYRNLSNVPLILVGTQDSICSERPRVIFDDRAKKLASDLKRCAYYESCSTYGLNVDHRRLNDLGFGRNIPVKQGWLLKRTSKGKISNKEWKKKYVALEDEGNLTYYSSMHDYMENINKKSLSVVKTTIKVPGRHPSVTSKSSPTSKTGWFPSHKFIPCLQIISSQVHITKQNLVKHSFFSHESSNYRVFILDENAEFHLISMDGISWQFMSSCSVERDEWVTAIERQIMIGLQNFSSNKPNPCKRLFNEIAGNTACVDCSAPDPTWVSLNLGCLMCIECSGIHRNLGTHISRVRSLELDDWPLEFTKILDKTGNLIANSVWEGLINNEVVKPDLQTSREVRETFIRDKYERKLFLPKLSAKYAADISSSLCYAIADGNSQLTMHLLAHASRDDVNRPVGSEQQAPLHVASSVADLASVQLLLWSRADPNQPDGLGQTPISIAEQSGHWECHRVM
uniref:Small monomeric GTPase n=1 Tax=Ciona savignyi TaxID=51511 RepID=H2ZF76_CIOSA